MSPRSNGWYMMEPDSNSALSHSRGHTSNNEMIPFSSEAHSTVPQTQQRPRKGSYGYYSIVPGDLPVVGAVEPRGSTSFTLKGSEKGSKETDRGAKRAQRKLTCVPTAGFALESYGFPSLKRGLLTWNPTFHH